VGACGAIGERSARRSQCAQRGEKKNTDHLPPLTQPIVHVAFIPAIIVLGLLYTEPRPTLAQLLTPM
jgi:TOM7 family